MFDRSRISSRRKPEVWRTCMRRDPEMRSSWSSSGQILTLIYRTNQRFTESIQRKFFSFNAYNVSKKSGKESRFCSGLINLTIVILLFLTVMTDFFSLKMFCWSTELYLYSISPFLSWRDNWNIEIKIDPQIKSAHCGFWDQTIGILNISSEHHLL